MNKRILNAMFFIEDQRIEWKEPIDYDNFYSLTSMLRRAGIENPWEVTSKLIAGYRTKKDIEAKLLALAFMLVMTDDEIKEMFNVSFKTPDTTRIVH